MFSRYSLAPIVVYVMVDVPLISSFRKSLSDTNVVSPTNRKVLYERAVVSWRVACQNQWKVSVNARPSVKSRSGVLGPDPGACEGYHRPSSTVLLTGRLRTREEPFWATMFSEPSSWGTWKLPPQCWQTPKAIFFAMTLFLCPVATISHITGHLVGYIVHIMRDNERSVRANLL